jgi:small-conductance mechanosensitive channel
VLLLQLLDPTRYKTGYQWFTEYLLQPAVYTILTLFILLFLRRIINKIVWKYYDDDKTRIRWRKSINYTFYTLSVMILLPVWAPPLRDLATFLGIFGAGVVIAFKDILLSVGYWSFIILRKPFEIGDRIQIGDISGDVLDIQLFDFTLLEVLPKEKGGLSTGRVIRIPNNWLGSHPLANSSKDFSLNWNEIKITLSPSSNWKKCELILVELAESKLTEVKDNDWRLIKARDSLGIHYSTIKSRVYFSYDNGLPTLTLRHLTDPKKTRDLTDNIWRYIFDRVEQENDIAITEISNQ